MQTAVTYARYSSDRQHESSIEAQELAIRKYAESHDIRIVEAFRDRGISGTTDERPAFRAMVSSLRDRPVDFVLVHKYDRFARNRYDAAIYGHQIEKAGARLIAVAQDFGTTPEAIIMESLMQAWAEYYSRNLATETLKGLRVKAARGSCTGGVAPFGYRYNEDKSNLVIVEDEAAWVRRIFETHRNGRGMKRLCDQMTAAGVRGRRGRPFRAAAMTSLLRNPVYIGVYQRSMGGEAYRIEDHHPAIISKELFEEVNRIMEQRTFAGRSPDTRRYLLTGIARCGYCDGPLTGHVTTIKGVEYPSYFCRTCAKHPAPRLHSIRIRELDTIAVNYVRQLLTPEVQQAATKALSGYIEGRTKEAKARAPETRRQIEELQAKIDAIMANMSSGVLPPSVLQRLGDQVTHLESEIDARRKLMQAPPPADASGIADFFRTQADITIDTPFEIAQPIIAQYIQSIILTNDKIEIRSTFADWLKKNGPDLAEIISNDRFASLKRYFDIIVSRSILRASHCDFFVHITHPRSKKQKSGI